MLPTNAARWTPDSRERCSFWAALDSLRRPRPMMRSDCGYAGGGRQPWDFLKLLATMVGMM